MNNRPKIGLALSGGSTKAIAHIGIIDVFQENNIPIDYVTGCSSGAIVAASFACGTLEEFKDMFFNLNKQEFLKYLKFFGDSGGIFDSQKILDLFYQFTKGKKFEEVSPGLCLVACDIQTGELVNLNLGDIAAACMASCSMPFIMPPMRWGSRILVDGGLGLLTPPIDQAKEMGADITIGVDIFATRNMFSKQGVNLRRGFNSLRKLFNRECEAEESLFLSDIDEPLSWFKLIGKAIDVEIKRKGDNAKLATCDIMLEPNVKHFGKIETENLRMMYKEGRTCALEALPRIKKIINNYKPLLKI